MSNKVLRKLQMRYENSLFYKYIGSVIAHPKKFFFCLKYPFWKQTNVWTGKFMGYKYTWYDSIEPGWKIAFGKQLSLDIAKAFKETKLPKRKWSKNIYWQDIKEKWGELCLYASAPDKVRKVLDRYELLSQGYCIYCGKPARYLARGGWIHFACEKCFMDELLEWKHQWKDITDDDIKKELKISSLTKKDIRHISRYENGKKIPIDIKKEYNIDFEELWGLK